MSSISHVFYMSHVSYMVSQYDHHSLIILRIILLSLFRSHESFALVLLTYLPDFVIVSICLIASGSIQIEGESVVR
jgi:hypothetical protein